MSISSTPWGRTKDGGDVTLFTLRNAKGLTAKVCNYGATLVNLITPDRDAKMADVVLGFDSLDGYLGAHPFFGCVAGRYANRISKGHFVLNGKPYQLATNGGENHLHGGKLGFNRALWQAEATANGVTMRHHSPDGDEGYPGALTCSITYALTDDNSLALHYEARSDADTVLNLTNHSYFNLEGAIGKVNSIADHVLDINATHYLPTNASMIPTGTLREVQGTPMDFRSGRRIGDDIGADFPDLKQGQGYDHNWCLDGSGLRLAITAYAPNTGRWLECYTDQPGVQFYSGNLIGRNGPISGKGGATYVDRSGFCLETQHYPDSPNQPAFPSTVLRKGETFRSTTVYVMSVGY